jgi:glycosyltransferase involved in cell wall biosynthesis
MSNTQAIRLAYILAKFPKITEAFILNEIMELRKRGISVDIFPLFKTTEKVVHPEVKKLTSCIHYSPYLSGAIIHANFHFLFSSPIKYIQSFFEIAIHTFGSWNFFFVAIACFPKTVGFAYKIQQLNITHIHAHFANHPTVSALIIHRLTGIPFSFTAHGSDIHRNQRMLDRKIDASQLAVMVSEYNKQFICDRFKRDFGERMQVIHCGVDTAIVTKKNHTNNNTNNHTVQILCIAALRNVKGHKYLIEACHSLKKEGVKFRLHLVGGGPLEEEIKTKIKDLSLENEIVMHGPLSRPRVISLLESVDIVALTSIMDSKGRREGIPVSLMEAMAFSLPVVSSKLSGIPELVCSGETGILATPGNSKEIFDALYKLCNNPDLRNKMGKAGKEKVLKEFNLIPNIDRLIKTMLGN